MKIEKSNNPAAVGALILVLVVIVGRIVWMLVAHGQAASAASRTTAFSAPSTPHVAATSAAAALPAVPAVDTVPVPAQAQPAKILPAAPPAAVTARNPFALSVPVRPSSAPVRSAVTVRDPNRDHAQNTRIMPLPPLAIGADKQGGIAGAGQLSPLPGMRVQPMSAGRIVSTHEPPVQPSPVQSLKLTAIVDGTTPMAIVQAAQPEPVVLHVGDDLDGMHVIAIHDEDMVFARGSGHWTLRLQSAADAGAPGSVSVSSVTVSEEKTNEVQ